MKKLLLKIFKEKSGKIASLWVGEIRAIAGSKLSVESVEKFVDKSIDIFLDILENSDYSSADQYLIESYTLFTEARLNLIKVSQIFGLGRNALMNVLEKMELKDFDPLILVGFVDEIIEQTYARYGMLHQEVQMKELTHDRNRLAAKLESNQQYLEKILYSIDQAIMIIDKNEKFIAWNKGAEKLFQYTEEEVLNKRSSFLLPKGKEYKDELDKIIKTVFEKGYCEIPDTERLRKDGNAISVQLNVAKLVDSENRYEGRSVIIKDVTKEKILQRQVDQSEKLAVIGQLAAGIAHEIGNPLAAISGIVQILQRKSHDVFGREQLADIKENIDRISKIVRELVDFSRPPSHEENFVLVNDVIRTALGIVKYDKRVKKIDFRTELNSDLPKILLVPDQLLQVFVNILINAIDAVNGEGVIEVQTHRDNQFIYIDIADEGIGMDDATIKKIFDPFFTTKKVGKGTGLGLSVSYGIVKKFGGDILVKSNINKGSVFTIKLPIEQKKIGDKK